MIGNRYFLFNQTTKKAGVDGISYHYVWNKTFSKLSSTQMRSKKNRRLNYFASDENFNSHYP